VVNWAGGGHPGGRFQNAAGGGWGRPVDAVADGALYVSDGTAGAVYRLAPPG
jgi:glucose/arabinose dehydrogenase